MQIAILGRQPGISLAELESLFGAQKVTPVSGYAAVIDVTDPLPQARLGGTMKSAKLLTRLENTNLEDAFAYLQTSVPGHLQYLPEGKLQLGVSVYGFKAQRNWLLKQTLTLKKIIKKEGRSVRVIENKSEALESAQVLYNKLTGPLGWELLLIKDGDDCLVAQTTGVQNIDDYSKRDFDRPMRDAFVGMLPPKLAQIMINLTVASVAFKKNHAIDAWAETYELPFHILDPFCGTGVVLQEALLMGYSVLGSDIEPRMTDYSNKNLQWLISKYHLEEPIYQIYMAYDARTAQWPEFSHVVCETYLGKPLSSLPDPDKLEKVIAEANQITEGFLKNIAPQLKKGARLCVALPAWHLGNDRFKHLKVLDHLADLGYNRLDLKHATNEDLIYHREDQIVARELTILEKN